MHSFVPVSSRPPGPLDDALRAELSALAAEVSRACPAHRMSRREVTLPAQLPLALRWFWEAFGHSALTQRCVAPDDPAALASALDQVREWAALDARYAEVAARVGRDHHVVAVDDDEVVLVSRGRARMEEDPPLVALRAPTGTAEAPDLEPRASSALRYLVSGVLKGLWTELVRVLLVTRPPLDLSVPFPRLAPHVGRAEVAGAPVWVAERPVRDRAGFALYFTHDDAEAVEAWLSREGLGDHLLV